MNKAVTCGRNFYYVISQSFSAAESCYSISVFFFFLLPPGPFSCLLSFFFCLFCFVCFCFFVLLKILQYFSLGDWLFCMAPVWQPGEVSWSMVCAACCHMALVIGIRFRATFGVRPFSSAASKMWNSLPVTPKAHDSKRRKT